MTESNLKVTNTLSSLFIFWLQKIRTHLIGYPGPDDPLSLTISSLNFFEYLTKLFTVTRFGYIQCHQPGKLLAFNQPKVQCCDPLNTTLQVFTLLNICRAFALLFAPTYQIRLFLGDPFIHAEHSLPLTFFALLAITVFAISREWFRYAESSGTLYILHDFHLARSDNFESIGKELTPRKLRAFRSLIHLITTFFSRFIIFSSASMAIMLNVPLFANPLFYRLPLYTLTCTLWSVTLTFAMVFQFTCTIAIGGHFIMIATLPLIRYKSLVERGERIVSKMCTKRRFRDNVNHHEIEFFIQRTISLSNETETISLVLKNIVLWFILSSSLIIDIDIFIGLITKTASELICYGLMVIAIGTGSWLSMCLYYIGELCSDLDKIHSLFQSISRRQSHCLLKRELKVLEIFDRLIGPFNGIKIGDLSIITKQFCINLLLENASTLMLFTCNVQPYLIEHDERMKMNENSLLI